jgi:hypothetical protein
MESVTDVLRSRVTIAVIAALAAVAIITLVVTSVGSETTSSADAGRPASGAESPDSSAAAGDEGVTECASVDAAVDVFSEFGDGNTPLDDGIAALERIREGRDDLDAELTILIDSYSAIADGDLTALGESDRVEAIADAAERVTSELSDHCPDALDTLTSN